MKNIIPSVKGTRDFYPEEMAIRTWLYQKIRDVSESFGYQEWEAPILEKLDLYAAKSGEELVKEQAFVFNDRGGDQIALRPELTPSLARLVAQKQNELVFPLRWWSFGPFWRYERPQKGRTREFFQWNIDLIGGSSFDVDAENIAVAATFLKSVGLTSELVKIHINDRRLMETTLSKVGIKEEQRTQVFRLIDRQDKLPLIDWENYGVEQGLSLDQVKSIEALLEDENLWQESEHLKKIFNILGMMGVGDYIKFDAHIIRGLDYYTGTVFEARHTTGEGRAVLGGGHYDNLVAAVGGDPLSAVGFAMGDVMVSFLLNKYNLIPTQNQTQAQVMMTVFDESKLARAYSQAAEIRESGIKTMCYPEAVKLPKQLKYADRLGIRLIIIEGPDEENAGTITIKDLKERSQINIPKEELIGKLKEILA